LAAETANNVEVNDSLIPAFTFGIPGSSPTVIMSGAILVQGLRPGAKLFTENALDMYILIGGLFLGSILFCVSVTLVIQIARTEANPKLTALSFIASIVFCFTMYYIFRHLFHINLP
jgi:putative tricarboxylic transport membrane protein